MKSIFEKVKFISAGAGSGKTYALMEELYADVSSGEVDPRSVVAVTFTVKAAAELTERVRQKLLENGKVDLARAMESARIGTVHSVCAELLQEYCYERGMSPDQTIISEDQATLRFREAVAPQVDKPEWKVIAEKAAVFGKTSDDFIGDVTKIGELARGNRITEDEVRQSAAGSIAQIEQAFGPPSKADVEAQLIEALRDFLTEFPAAAEETEVAMKAHAQVKRLLARVDAKAGITWENWAQLTRIKFGRKANHHTPIITQLAQQFVRIPKFQKDVESLIEAVHEAAAAAMEAYARKKAELGSIDFTDIELQFFELLSQPRIAARLGQSLKLLYVDEFQDTNPIQLAIFSRLAQLCQKTTWVGDSKQSIYAFRGADPILMREVLDLIPEKNRDVLKGNWRSAPELVKLTSCLFSNALAVDGVKPQEVGLTPKKNYKSTLPSLQWWCSSEKNIANHMSALAAQIEALLKSEEQITDGDSGAKRKIRAGDIAVLVRVNNRIPVLQAALAAHGISASCRLEGLTERPEVAYALAAYRYVIDSHDTVAASEFLLLSGMDRNEWLRTSIENPKKADTWHPALQALSGLRQEISELTPSEILDRAISRASVEEAVTEWGSAQDRLGSLIQLRVLAREYEALCGESGRACTPVGLLSHLAGEAGGGESVDRPDAVNILTWHRAKGLEWPVVILTDLDAGLRLDGLFGARVAAAEVFDANNPLANRVIKYLPYIFQSNSNPPELVQARLDADPEHQKLERFSTAQERRLLYVGMTRPRESLILFVPKGREAKPDNFLGTLKDESGNLLLQFPAKAGAPLVIAGKDFPCALVPCSAPSVISRVKEEKLFVLPKSTGVKAPADFPLLRGSPSTLEHDGDVSSMKAFEVIRLGPGLTITSTTERDALGDAIHTFLGSDDAESVRADRIQRAKELLVRWNLHAVLTAEDLVRLSDGLHEVLRKRWPGAQVLCEWPMALRRGETLVHGFLDMLIVSDQELVIVDHKATEDDPAVLVKRYAAQLLAYREAVAKSQDYPGRKVRLCLHLPLRGEWVEVG